MSLTFFARNATIARCSRVCRRLPHVKIKKFKFAAGRSGTVSLSASSLRPFLQHGRTLRVLITTRYRIGSGDPTVVKRKLTLRGPKSARKVARRRR